ncbi:unnamed protein product [Caenorhabditis auriculariae]|uniref:G-protein coupled receptors family 1 profile domain-containing protein n=1 Tax=Caenorhabditis auriculariae TaxID=2777116 RepID=A0A8S1GT88_9PELO|nr:unnamed protein product [Caenorhabditis auriculariae]
MEDGEELVEAVVSILIIFGLFGNANVVFAIARNKELRTKSGCLVFVLSVSHLVCIFSEMIGLTLRLRFRPMSRRKCFEYNAAYVFCIMFQSALFLAITVDLALSILCPIRHRLWNKYRYVATLCLPPFIYASVCCLVGFVFMNDEITPTCIPVTATLPEIYISISSVNVFCNLGTIFLTGTSIYIFMHRERPRQSSRRSYSTASNDSHEKNKIFRSTFYLMTVYIASWVLACFLFEFFISYYDAEVAAREYLPYLILIAMPTYCQTYFVTFARSPRYRRVYLRQLRSLTRGRHFPPRPDWKPAAAL